MWQWRNAGNAWNPVVLRGTPYPDGPVLIRQALMAIGLISNNITFCNGPSKFEFRQHPWKFLTYGIRDYDCILGLEFLRQAKAIINVFDRTLTIGSGSQTHTFHCMDREVTCNAISTSLTNLTITPSNFSKERIWKQFPTLFPATKPNTLPPFRKINHDIPIKDKEAKLPAHRIPIPINYYSHLKEKLASDLAVGRIRQSTSPYASPMFCVPKKDKLPRFVIDLKRRNSNTISRSTSIANQQAILAKMASAPYRSKIDLLDAYGQVRIEPDSVPFTAFSTPFGTFESLTMEQGDANSPHTFTRIMTDILWELIPDHVLPYLDDIFIFSNTMEDHIRHIIKVCTLLTEHKFFASREKSDFFTDINTEIDVLGHTIKGHELLAAPSKITKITDFPAPTNKKELQSFIGTVNFLKQFAPSLQIHLAPLTDLLGKNVPWQWTDTRATCFDTIKRTIAARIPLIPVDPNKADPIFLVTDASQLGLGGWIGQGPTYETARPAAFHSRKFQRAQT